MYLPFKLPRAMVTSDNENIVRYVMRHTPAMMALGGGGGGMAGPRADA
jgi:hypothetical protein